MLPANIEHQYDHEISWGKSIYVSDFTNVTSSNIDSKLIGAFHNHYENIDESESMCELKIGSSDQSGLVKLSTLIDEGIKQDTNFIDELDHVLDSAVFPNNRPTRMVQDYHGPKFSLKGYIKFLSTDGQYKKIYENMIGHPIKDYVVSVILDVSASMAGMAAIGSRKAFIGLAGKFVEQS